MKLGKMGNLGNLGLIFSSILDVKKVITFTYRYKIKPNKQQIRQFEQYLDICRSVYNFALAERKAWLESRKSKVDRCSIISEYIIPSDTTFPNYNNQAKALTVAKKQFPHLKLVNAQCLQQVLKKLDKAWLDFFTIPDRGFPRFKSKNRFRSFVFPQLGKSCLDNNRVKLPSIGWIKIRQSRSYPTGFVPKQFQIVKKASGYYLSIVFQSPSGIGSFINEILPFVCWKRGKYYLKVDKDYSSQTCPNCQLFTGKKLLSQRLHECQYCHVEMSRDTASAKIIEQRGKTAVHQTIRCLHPSPWGVNDPGRASRPREPPFAPSSGIIRASAHQESGRTARGRKCL